jgi:hypothetical protein
MTAALVRILRSSINIHLSYRRAQIMSIIKYGVHERICEPEPAPYPWAHWQFEEAITHFANLVEDARGYIMRIEDGQKMAQQAIRESEGYIRRNQRLIQDYKAKIGREEAKSDPENGKIEKWQRDIEEIGRNIESEEEVEQETRKDLGDLERLKPEWKSEQKDRQVILSKLRKINQEGLTKQNTVRLCGRPTTKSTRCRQECVYSLSLGKWGPCNDHQP